MILFVYRDVLYQHISLLTHHFCCLETLSASSCINGLEMTGQVYFTELLKIHMIQTGRASVFKRDLLHSIERVKQTKSGKNNWNIWFLG